MSLVRPTIARNSEWLSRTHGRAKRRRGDVSGIVTPGQVRAFKLSGIWKVDDAGLLSHGTARVESAARRRIRRVSDLAEGAHANWLRRAPGGRCCGKQRHRVGMATMGENVAGPALLDDSPQVRHEHSVSECPDHAQIVSDK